MTANPFRTTPIDPAHPLTEAARYVNSYAEEHGLAKTLEWLGMNVKLSEYFYLAEQRAFRAIAARRGINLNPTEPAAFSLTFAERALMMTLMSAYADGFAIGWKAHELAEKAK